MSVVSDILKNVPLICYAPLTSECMSVFIDWSTVGRLRAMK